MSTKEILPGSHIPTRDELPEDPFPPPDMLHNRGVNRFLSSRWWPAVLQIPILLFFIYLVYDLLAGPRSADMNLGSAVIWILWWSALPIAIVLLGRVWCAVCPFGYLNDLVQKVAGRRHKAPAFLKRNAMWIALGLFLVLTWFEHVTGIVEAPRATAVMLLIFAAAVVFFGAFYERRTWCRYVCPVGGMSSNYARAGMLELRAHRSTCSSCDTKACFRGSAAAPGCPMFEFPRAMDSSAECTLCADCVKTCPENAIRISPRMPTSELWGTLRPRLPVAGLAVGIMGIVLLENATMLPIWDDFMTILHHDVTNTANEAVDFTVAYLPTIAIPAVLVILAGLLAGAINGRTLKQNFSQFGYTMIPLCLGVHIAHSCFHLLGEGKALWYSLLHALGMHHQMAMGGMDMDMGLVAPDGIKIIQYTLIAAGTAAALFTAYRMAHGNRADPRPGATFAVNAAAIMALVVLNCILFAMPMAMEM